MRALVNIPILCGVCGIACGIPCGVKSLIYMGCAVCAVSIPLPSCAPVRTRVCMRAHTRTRLHTAHTAHTAHAPIHAGLRIRAHRTTSPTYRTKEKMDCQPVTRTLRCTPENEPEFRALLQDWPELRAYAKDLHAAGLLSGLRAMSITLTGSPAAVAGGVGAVRAARAAQAAKTPTEGQP